MLNVQRPNPGRYLHITDNGGRTIGPVIDVPAGEAAPRIRTAENRAVDRQEALTKLEADLARDLAAIDEKWAAKAAAIEPTEVPLERSDIRVTARCVVWIPVG